MIAIKDSLDLLARQVDLALSRDDRADLYGAFSNIEEALRTLKGLQFLMEDWRKTVTDAIRENELYSPDDNEPWWNR